MSAAREKAARWERKVEGDPETYEVIEACEKCGGSLKIAVTRRGRRAVLACACECMRAAFEGRDADGRATRVDRLKKECFAFSTQRAMTFESSERDLGEVLRYAERFEELGPKGYGLLLHGPKGSGKTYAACAVANRVVESGRRAKVTSVSRAYNEVMESFEGRQDRIDSLARFDLVIVDDFGSERSSESVEEVAYQIFDALYQARKPMVVTTNLDRSQVGGRIGSRILERCLPVEMKGSVRAEKAAQMYIEISRERDGGRE